MKNYPPGFKEFRDEVNRLNAAAAARARPMVVYVAGTTRRPRRAETAMDAIRLEPTLELAHDWLAEIAGETKPDAELTDDDRVRYALGDLAAVQRSDVLWLLATEETVGLGRGAWVELGFAYGLAAAGGPAPLVVVSGGAHRCIFTAPHPNLAHVEFTDDLAAIDFIRSYGRRETTWGSESMEPEPDPSRAESSPSSSG